MPGRRLLLKYLAGLTLANGLPAWAQALETIALWPGTPPDGPGPQGPEQVSARGAVTQVAVPHLRVYRPARPNGGAALVMAGGGYARIECGKESTPAARWLQARGVTAFELIYRLSGEGWAQPLVPLQDGQRAMRLVRQRAVAFGVEAGRIGVLGFSAGGHLAGMTAVQPDATPDATRYQPVDSADVDAAVSARPDFAALLYPVLSMRPPLDRTRSRRELLGAHPTAAARAALSVEMRVTPAAPPTFLAHALDDPIASVDHSRRLFAALRQAGVPTELQVFATGGHGWGLGVPGSEAAAWPGLFEAWAARQGWFGWFEGKTALAQ